MTCEGDGACLDECYCRCVDEETDEYDDECTCGHREHEGDICPIACCVPVSCRNYKHCNELLSQRVAWCHNGMCINCAVQLGPHKSIVLTPSEESKECPVCLATCDEAILQLQCGHFICNECWFAITARTYDNEEDDTRPTCPLCRSANGWGDYVKAKLESL